MPSLQQKLDLVSINNLFHNWIISEVKFTKKKQDLRVDLPTIGLKTIKQSKTAGLKGIVIKSKQHVFLDKTKCIKFANKNKMFISVKWKKFLY